MEAKRETVPKTCEEIHSFDHSKTSGTYRIDPDGPLIGDDPITVYCNMETGRTCHVELRLWASNNIKINELRVNCDISRNS